MNVIVSAIIASEDIQNDGRKWVHEVYTDSNKIQYERWYLCKEDFDTDSALADYTVTLNNQLQMQQNVIGE